PGEDDRWPLRRGLAPGRPRAAQAARRPLAAARASIATARARRSPRRRRAAQDEGMTERRPPWAWLFLAQLALVVLASVMATLGVFPTAVFRSPFDKLGHLCAYGLLAFLGVAFFGRARARPVVASLLLAATLEELSQRAFPTRTFDLADLAMNVAGICV